MNLNYEVLELLPGKRGMVSTSGLYRVERIRDDKVVAELKTAKEAQRLIKARAACCRDPNDHYRKVSYGKLPSTPPRRTVTVYVVHEYDSDRRFVSTFDELFLAADDAEAFADGWKGCHQPGTARTMVEALAAEISPASPPAELPAISDSVLARRRPPAVV